MALYRTAALVSAALGLTLFGCSHEGPQASLGSDVGLYFQRSGPTVTLAYGRANSDEVGLVLQCQAGTGMVDVSDVAGGGSPSSLVLTSGRARSRLSARIDTVTGQPTLWARARIDAPALDAFRRSGRIGVTAGGAHYSVTASRREKAGVESFFRTCTRA